MRKSALFALLLVTACSKPDAAPGGNAGSGSASSTEVKAWEEQAARVTIIRDDWGIPHVYGKSDADAVFGMIYAQAEDDFNRIETNYLVSLGRLSEAEGEKEVWRDLRQHLFIDAADLQKQYAGVEPWLKALCTAWADGLNYYLHMHPETKPRVLTHFEPWMALSFSEGSIGGDIEDVNLRELRAFYDSTNAPQKVAVALDVERRRERFAPLHEPSGSNGFAIAPQNTANKRALLLINPHTSFFFREEAQMVSEEGLNAYGAATWGQFFIYQGFNDKAGWMHTSSGADVIDEYAETVTPKDGGYVYTFDGAERQVTSRKVTLKVKGETGMQTREFTVYATQHGPVVRKADGKWISVALMNEPVKALTQSYMRIKAKNYNEFRATMELHTNSSNNTVFADHEGNIAYFHANRVPKRNPKFDWTKPVDGTTSATNYAGVHSLDESPNVLNPATGFIQNTNNWPYSVSGAASPKRADFPSYMDLTENPRGVHALRVLDGKKDFTIEKLRDAAYDSYLPAFADLVPLAVKAYDGLPMNDPLRPKLAEQVNAFRQWDYRWGLQSIPTTLAVWWGTEMVRAARSDEESEDLTLYEYMAQRITPHRKLEMLAAASDTLTKNFGTWKTFWGDVNRFQRRTGDIVQPFSDDAPSIAVPFTSSQWGSLASFGVRTGPSTTKKLYGVAGNSFVAVVEFGDSVRAKAVTAGGLNGNPSSKHFNDQAQRYADGALRDVYFYRSQLAGHTEREYHPGK